MSSDVVIVDLGTGNLRSVSKAVSHVSRESAVSLSDDPTVIGSAGHLVLPGQGAIGTWMSQLDRNPQLHNAVMQRISDGPVLGICLGLQALFESSEENGGTRGLGLLRGKVKRFNSSPPSGRAKQGQDTHPRLKVPHMGWNTIEKCGDHPLWYGIADSERFYFVHSYYAVSDDPAQLMATCSYGREFTAAAGTGHLFATQFHPEKSQQAGLRLLKNFLNWNGDT